MATYNEQRIDGWAEQQQAYIAACDRAALSDCLDEMAHHYGDTAGLDAPVTSAERALMLAYTNRLIAYAKSRLAHTL